MTKNTRKISSNRVKKIKERKNIILIGVEGNNKTERLYFNNFDTGKQNYRIKIAFGNDTDPHKMILSLSKEIKKLDLDLKNNDKAYCIFDMDTNIDRNKLIQKAKKLANSLGIEIITSTPSIELWFLLHFEYTSKYLTNEELIKRLRKHIPKYEKNLDIYNLINNDINKAIKNAKKLEKYQVDNNKRISTVEANPNTEIYKLIEYLYKSN